MPVLSTLSAGFFCLWEESTEFPRGAYLAELTEKPNLLNEKDKSRTRFR